MGHGKIEAFNRFCTNNFIAEVKASTILTLDQLNDAFKAWTHEEYNHRKHSELGMTPSQRWHRDASRAEYIDEEKIRIVFLWRELRTADKTGVIRLFNRPYKVIPSLARKRVEVRYHPEHLDQIEIYLDGSFKQRAKPLQISPNRAPKEPAPVEKNLKQEKLPDYLLWLTQKHAEKIKIGPRKKEGAKRLQGFIALLEQYIHPDVFDPSLATEFFLSFGPFDTALVKDILIDLLAAHPANLHMSFYLNHIHQQLFGGK